MPADEDDRSFRRPGKLFLQTQVLECCDSNLGGCKQGCVGVSDLLERACGIANNALQKLVRQGRQIGQKDQASERGGRRF